MFSADETVALRCERPIEPARKSWRRRQRHERLEARRIADKIFRDLLQKEVAERNALEAFLAVRDRIEDGRRRRGAVIVAPSVQDRRDRIGDIAHQRHLDEDQRLVDESRMKECKAAPVSRVEAATQVVPAADFVDRFVSDDLLENGRRRLPVDPPQDEEAAVEPRRQQPFEIAVDGGQRLVRLDVPHQVGAQRDDVGGGSRRQVQAPEKFEPRAV